MEILIISGLSGAGKSRVATYLEDIGYYIVDNLPAEMMAKFAEFCSASSGRYDKVALVYDVRAGEPFDKLIDTVEGIKQRGVQHKIGVVPHRAHQLPLQGHRLCHGALLPPQGVDAPRLLIAVDNGLGLRLQEQHPAPDTPLLDAVPGGGDPDHYQPL